MGRRYTIHIVKKNGRSVFKVISTSDIRGYMAKMAARYKGIQAFSHKEIR